MELLEVEKEIFKASFRRYVSKVEEKEYENTPVSYDDYRLKLESFIKEELMKDKKRKDLRKFKMTMMHKIKIDTFTEKYLLENI